LEITPKGLLLNKLLISPLLLTVFLQACGGSSSDAPEPPLEPVERTFSLTSQLTNSCGVTSAFMDIELLLQDETWQTITSHKPDENGVISFVTDNEYINYTLVAKDQKGVEAQGLNVVSFYQASSSTAAHYQAQFDEQLDNSSCECVTQNLKLTHSPLETQTKVTSSLSFDSWVTIDSQNTLFEGVKACKVKDGDWPLHSFSVAGTNVNQDIVAVGEFLDLNAAVSDEGVWTLFAIQSARTYELKQPYQNTSSVQLIKGTKHFATEVSTDEQSLLIFDTHPYVSEAIINLKPM